MMAQPIMRKARCMSPRRSNRTLSLRKLMQPTQRAFDNPSMYSQATAMYGTSLCQHRPDVEPSQLLAKGPRVVCPVSVKLMRTPSRPASLASHWGYSLHQGKRLSDVVRIGSGQRSGQRNPLSVGNHVVLASCLSSIGRVGAREVPPKTALTDALSTTARLQSIRSALCNCSKRRSCSLSHTPACCQSRSLRQHVIPLPQPISWGKVLPRDACLENEQHSGQRLSVGYSRTPSLRLWRLGRQQGFNLLPQLVGDQYLRHG